MDIPFIKEPVKTERLTLGPLREQDVPAIADMFMDAGVTRYFMVPDYETRAEYEHLARLQVQFSQKEDTKHLVYGVFSGGACIGFFNDCGQEDGTVEIGYVIAPAYQGRGFATEAFKALFPELKRMGFSRVTAGYFIENEGSRHVMEKCGLIPTGDEDEETYRGETMLCREMALEL